jgi:hypothetical protein
MLEDELEAEFGSSEAVLQQSKGRVRLLQGAYSRLFSGVATVEDVDAVKKDLAFFCFMDRSAFGSNSREHARNEGRREVLQRVLDFSKKDMLELESLYLIQE